MLFAVRRLPMRLLTSFFLVLSLLAGSAPGSIRPECCRGAERRCDEATAYVDCCSRNDLQAAFPCCSARSAATPSKHGYSDAAGVMPDCCCDSGDVPAALPPTVYGEIVEHDNMPVHRCGGAKSHAGISAAQQTLTIPPAYRRPPDNLCVMLCRWQC